MVDNTPTRMFSVDEIKRENVKKILHHVYDVLVERGHDPVVQIVGYLTTKDPAYISSYKDARRMIQTVDRDEILKELVKEYIKNEK